MRVHFLHFLCATKEFRVSAIAVSNSKCNALKYQPHCLIPGASFYHRCTHVGDNEKIIGEEPGRNRIQDGGFTIKLI